MRETRTSAAVGLLALLLLLSTAARADDHTVEDPRDASIRLDVRSISHGHGSSPDRGAHLLRHHIETHLVWRTRSIRCSATRCKALLTIQFDTDSDRRFERMLYISQSRRRLSAEMFRHTKSNDQCQLPRVVCGREGFIKNVAVWRADRSSVTVRFPRWTLRRDAASYRWRVVMEFHSSDKCEGNQQKYLEGAGYSCRDFAPDDDRFVQHVL